MELPSALAAMLATLRACPLSACAARVATSLPTRAARSRNSRLNEQGRRQHGALGMPPHAGRSAILARATGRIFCVVPAGGQVGHDSGTQTHPHSLRLYSVSNNVICRESAQQAFDACTGAGARMSSVRRRHLPSTVTH